MVKRLTASEWTRIFEGWERSGQTQGAYCNDHGIRLNAFKNRRYEQMKKSRQSSPNTAVMLPVKVTTTLSLPTAPAPELFLQLPNGACLRFVTGTSVAYVSSLVEAIVEGRGC